MDKEKLKEMAKDEQFISGIYNYCDRWCEHCPQTSRCLNYAMGEEEFADPEARDIRNKAFWVKISQTFQGALELLEEMAASRGIDLNTLDFEQSEDENLIVQEKTRSHGLSRSAMAYSDKVEDWFNGTAAFFENSGEEGSGPLLPGNESAPGKSEIEESLEIVRWYQHQIYVKTTRAISGRVKEESEASNVVERLARDSDGSAKVALIGIDRSIGAWSIIGSGFPFFRRNDVKDMLTLLERLRRRIEKEFPDARGFIRPGFDPIDFNS